MLTQAQQRKAAREFAKEWAGKGYEKGQSQVFWMTLLHDVLGVERPQDYLIFEDQVKLDNTAFIDGRIKATNVLIEQKSIEKDLTKPIRQSDGALLSPFQQAKRYSAELPYSERPRWIVISNFKEFFIYDMEKPNGEPEIVYLKDLEEDYYRLEFLVDKEDENIKKELEVSIQAGELVGKLYDALLKEYNDPEDEKTLHDLNQLCVRLVFCFYAEDSGLFGKHNKFHDYLHRYKDSVSDFRDKLIKLFQMLNTKIEDRDTYEDEMLLSFPYVNGGLFENANIEIPRLNPEIIDIILIQASENFDWSKISPTIFGGVFESTLNPDTRRAGGMHYTSIENIHKVIDPLFLNDLKEEFKRIKEIKVEKTKKRELDAFQNRLASLKFLDPAAGSGNFLTETYISLRKLENEILKEKVSISGTVGTTLQVSFDTIYNPIKVSINQFYGIEINDFAVTVARTALWIAESQMMQATEDIIHTNIDFFPLKTYANIIEGNALRIDWEDIVPKDELNYIMGNPPFVGHQWRSHDQVVDMDLVFYDYKKHGKLDYVCAWYTKSANFMMGTKIKCSFVSTNSICQGESVPVLWEYLFENKNVEIQFAYETFVWSSEAIGSAAVHCVIIGFTTYSDSSIKLLYDNKGRAQKVKHINGYLVPADNVFIYGRNTIINKSYPKMTKGSQPTDGGGLTLDENEYQEFLKKYPDDADLVKPYIGSYELINGKIRHCLWLKDVEPKRFSNNSFIIRRLEKVSKSRLDSKTISVREYAQYPYLFTQVRQPTKDYLAVPAMSSSSRKYIPIGFLNKNIICSNQLYIVESNSLELFAMLTSNVHMAWMKTICGRLKSDYRYAPFIYNNFPFPDLNSDNRKKLAKTAQDILNARALYSGSSLADLYNDLTMPVELRKAHQENDKAVMEAYGFDWRNMTESECVGELMKLYQNLVES
ncbi:DNA methyltransferase [Peptoniphilus duerdenii]|uniref:DNA methyltransferase n=1 Tax=Peptoniphilus duerdenii TaxID=507750 RepID=UPI0023F19F0B|nr:DNA methyltransferase [Peptoniphilus duerdenii]